MTLINYSGTLKHGLMFSSRWRTNDFIILDRWNIPFSIYYNLDSEIWYSVTICKIGRTNDGRYSNGEGSADTVNIDIVKYQLDLRNCRRAIDKISPDHSMTSTSARLGILKTACFDRSDFSVIHSISKAFDLTSEYLNGDRIYDVESIVFNHNSWIMRI